MSYHESKYHKALNELEEIYLKQRNEIAYKHALAFVLNVKMVSISKIQRALQIGYNEAANIIERMEIEGLITRPEANGNRKLLPAINDVSVDIT